MAATRYVPTPFSYSSAVEAGGFVFLGLHRGFGETFVEQLDGAVEAVGATLGGLGLALPDVVRVGVWLRDVSDLPAMEERFTAYFADGRFPARMTATTEFVDDDCLVMLDGIACRG